MLNNLHQNRRKSGSRAQAMVEFAIVAPILFLLLFGIIEVGRMIFLYAAVTNSSREAVRFGSAVGYDDAGVIKYKHCAGIRDVARRASYFMNLPDANIVIGYTQGTNITPYAYCNGTEFAGYIPDGDRVMVEVSATYKPYTKLIPWGSRTFRSKSYRTILGYVGLGQITGGGSTPPTSVGGNTPVATATETPGPTPTPTDTPTVTPTFSGEVSTLTPVVTWTSTNTPTETPTDTPTFTPTSTPTVVPLCNQITTGPIIISYNYMAMTITNPHAPATVSSVQVAWNTSRGAPSQNALFLKSASLVSLFWTGTDNTGNKTIPSTDFASVVTIPGNSATSTILFTFDDFYDNPDGTESITITLSEPEECAGVTIQSPTYIPPTPFVP